MVSLERSLGGELNAAIRFLLALVVGELFAFIA